MMKNLKYLFLSLKNQKPARSKGLPNQSLPYQKPARSKGLPNQCLPNQGLLNQKEYHRLPVIKGGARPAALLRAGFRDARVFKRLAAVTVLTALLAPVFLFQPIYKTSARTLLTVPQTPAVVSAPPEAFVIADNSSLTALLTSAFGSLPAFSGEAVSGLTGKANGPKIPPGLEQPDRPLVLSDNQAAAQAAESNPNSLLTLPAAQTVVKYDFDGDGKADISRWKPSNQEWKYRNSGSSNTYSTATIGSSSAVPAPGDFDGDGRTDPAVFNAGVWTIKKSYTNQTVTVNFGTSGDRPVVGDYDGDGLADCAIFRPSTNTWWILNSATANASATSFGAAGDITAQGNYDGDSETDIAVYRPSTGDWHILGSTAGYYGFHLGAATDIPVPGDYDGDGITDFAVYRGATGTWYAAKSSTANAQYFTQTWGNFGDQPVPADYDGDGQDDFAIFRPTTGIWYIIKSSTGGYDYPPLGQSGDRAVPAAYLKQIGGIVHGYELAKARLAPKNATGGTDLYSRNFSWGTSLVGLSGRAGMDMNLGLSYNSLVWTKDAVNSTMVFDADYANVAPGFRFGFPSIEPVYFDASTGQFAFLMVTPSGGRVEFRQTAASGIYETADSSYAQLKIENNDSPNNQAETLYLTVTTTDGTRMSYEWKNDSYKCQKITDRNGNYITINHGSDGLLQSVTDTLGRVVNVSYDNDGSPSAITQTWKDNNGAGSNVTHTYATFAYTTQAITTNFGTTANPLAVIGPGGGSSVKVLQKITFPTETNGAGPNVQFDYNSYGQVRQVSNYAADAHLLNYTKTNLDDTSIANANSSGVADCPRFTETRSWAENFNLNQSNVAQEIVIANSLTENQSYSLPDAHSGTATLVQISMTGDPYGHVSKTYVGASGWMESLPIATEDWTGTSSPERKRWTWTDWTQDDVNLAYIQNPRSIESKVGDTTNIKRSTTEYYPVSANSPIALYGRVKRVRVYAADGTTVWKEAETTYNNDSAYLSRRMVNLPATVKASGFDQSDNLLKLVSFVTYNYDEGDFSDSTLEQNISSVIQHDNTNYSSSFVTGRGNLTSTTRCDANYTSCTNGITSSAKYNTAGSVVAQISPGAGGSNPNKQINISYADSFNDTTTRNTYAYPTKLTEANYADTTNNYSVVNYRFDTGANVWAKSPKPAGNTSGKETTRTYDAVGRLEKETLVNTGAYTRYEYPTNNIQSKIYATLIDTNNNGADSNDEVYSESWTDGAGRVRRARTLNPDSTGGWTGTLTEYDILGQVKRSTVPTEINSSYTPAGDDATRGWLWNSQEYDWKGRVTRSIPSDSNGVDGKDQLISYDGCGCAGGQVTTIQSESVPRDDVANTNARRTQKIYADILGRTFKTEVMGWDGTTVYTTTLQTFNGRDQVTNTRQYAGGVSSSTYQDVSMTYDGYGRMKTRHYPIEDANTETSWSYNADDSIQQVIDPRQVMTSFTYNTRGLLSGLSFQKPANSTIPDTPDASYTYDALGSRTQMTDGLGTVDYAYNELSQLTAETRDFSDSLSAEPTNHYKIQYTYNLSGGLKSITDPFGDEVAYTNDKTGRLTAVSGTPYGDNTTGEYADNIKYRAFGAVRQMDYKTNDNGQIRLSYDNRLRVSQHEVLSQSNQSGYLTKAVFSYTADNRPSVMDNEADHQFDRTFKYDFAGRLTANNFGSGQGTPPYTQTLSYDVFSQMTQRSITHWNGFAGFTAAYISGRKQAAGTQTPIYDEAGNLLNSGTNTSSNYQTSTFDEAGRQSSVTTRTRHNYGQHVVWVYVQTQTQGYDGDGHPLKTTDTWQRITTPGVPSSVSNKYEVWSSVTGTALTELTDTGAKEKTRVYAGGAVIAEQISAVNNDRVTWLSADPVTGSYSSISKNGTSYGDARKEYEPLGQEVLTEAPPDEIDTVQPETSSARSASEPEWLCGLSRINDLSFWEKPVQCQIASLESDNFFLGNLFSKGNAAHVSTAPPRGAASGQSGGLPVNLTPTNKPSSTASAATSLAITNTPSADGCNYDSQGNPNCAVQSQGAVDIPIKFTAEYDGAATIIPIAFKDNADARNALETIAKGNCGEKLKQLFGNLKSLNPRDVNPVTNTDILKLFDEIVGQKEGGLFVSSTSTEANANFLQLFPTSKLGPGGGGVSYANARGRFSNGAYDYTNGSNRYVYVFPRSTSDVWGRGKAPQSIINQRINTERNHLIVTLIHELAHAAGRNRTFAHSALDEAAKLSDSDLAKIPAVGQFSRGKSDEDTAPYFDEFVRKHCGLR